MTVASATTKVVDDNPSDARLVVARLLANGDHAGVLGFKSADRDFPEPGVAEIPVHRTDGRSGAVTIDYETVSGSASSGEDFAGTVLDMPMQYETLAGDMGSTLSAGQLQRIVLARALYREPQFLFLDEATAHLDTRTEKEINERLVGLNLTRVIAAHRPETIKSADSVWRFQRGRLIPE